MILCDESIKINCEVENMSTLMKISSILNINHEKLEKESLETYLHIRLRRCESEIFNIAKKYGILSIEEFEDRYKKGEIEEEGTWEDFFRLDHLEAERASLKKALEAVQ